MSAYSNGALPRHRLGFFFLLTLFSPHVAMATDVADLRNELSRIDGQLTEAKADDAKLSGGLNKALIETRIQVLATNRELVAQRIQASESGAKITSAVHSVQPDPTRADQLDSEIAKLDQEISSRRSESAAYSGGLIKATLESGIATMLNTRAMLESEMLAARYGIVWPAVTPAMLSKSGSSSEAKHPSTSSSAASRSVVEVTMSNKKHQKVGYQEFVSFDLVWRATGLKQTARAIKGTLIFADLFGEPKFRLGAQLTDQLEPHGERTQTGSGFDFNQFRNEHQWVATTDLNDMRVWFETSDVLYLDGTTEKF
jgi:hypothetical protein